MGARSLPAGKRRLMWDHRAGTVIEVVITCHSHEPGGWYNVRWPDGSAGRAHRDDLYATGAAAREFLATLIRLEEIEQEAHQAGLAANCAVWKARAPEVSAARIRLALLARGGMLGRA